MCVVYLFESLHIYMYAYTFRNTRTACMQACIQRCCYALEGILWACFGSMPAKKPRREALLTDNFYPSPQTTGYESSVNGLMSIKKKKYVNHATAFTVTGSQPNWRPMGDYGAKCYTVHSNCHEWNNNWEKIFRKNGVQYSSPVWFQRHAELGTWARIY